MATAHNPAERSDATIAITLKPVIPHEIESMLRKILRDYLLHGNVITKLVNNRNSTPSMRNWFVGGVANRTIMDVLRNQKFGGDPKFWDTTLALYSPPGNKEKWDPHLKEALQSCRTNLIAKLKKVSDVEPMPKKNAQSMNDIILQ